MEILKRLFIGVLIVALSGCGRVTITEILKLETDTYIASNDLANHSTLEHLSVSKDAGREERIMLKFPTGKRETDEHLDDVLRNPFAITLVPFIVYVAILEAILDCRRTVLRPENLTNAKLVLDVLSDSEGSLSGKLGLNLLAKPWWQNATWESAHYFSSRGRWSQQGGDTDSGFSRINNTVSGSSVEWDITQYFKSLISAQDSVHYGMLVSPNASMSRVTLVSTQGTSTTARPRIVATYTGSCLQSGSRPGEPRTFYLGSPSDR